jgi:hypothetical protein
MGLADVEIYFEHDISLGNVRSKVPDLRFSREFFSSPVSARVEIEKYHHAHKFRGR